MQQLAQAHPIRPVGRLMTISTCLFYKIYLLYISLNCLEYGPPDPDLYAEWAD
jgi:hypothetical protein